jgi:unsaturated rhamnogalacturonyl hydrolase
MDLPGHYASGSVYEGRGKPMNRTIAAWLILFVAPAMVSQIPAPPIPAPPKPIHESAAAGDAPTDPGPLATMAGKLSRPAVNAAMVKVMDWSLRAHESQFNRLWTYAALYDGLLAASAATGDAAGHDAVLHAAEGWQWQLLDTRFPHADDEALGQAYLELYIEHPDPARIAPTQTIMDRLVERPDVPGKPVWWWSDALFMAPPVLVQMYDITNDAKYLDTLDREWAITKAELYNPQQHLYARDDRFLDLTKQHEANGAPIFWSRGNGWVVAGLVDILKGLPANDPRRAPYAQQFVEMMTHIVALQPADGLWRTGLMDAKAYKMPEVSGSAFFAYAMAYGIRSGLLDRKTFQPALERCWSALVAHIYADGRLGNIQPIGAAPDVFTPSSSYVFGVGAFLLAGSEIDTMLMKKPHPSAP